MSYDAAHLLDTLMSMTPRLTSDAPRDARGLYGLVDHAGVFRYIGSTSSDAETFYKRIHQRHRTGSENSSHYFSRMYNTGRMWRDRTDATTKNDGDIAKALRNEFIAEHCRAVWLPLPDDLNIAQIEAEVLNIAPPHVIAWNRRGMEAYVEPVDLVNQTLERLGWGDDRLSAIHRQSQRFHGVSLQPARPLATRPARFVAPFPNGPFRFCALDVETANNNRGSICQIGIACVRHDNSIETWVTYVDPETDVWLWSGLHGITADTVRGAPSFRELLPALRTALEGILIYQHSGFDRSAIAAACENAGIAMPEWQWCDSVHVARAAWPELKGNGGHGLSSLKSHLGLEFNHHDAGEDARAAAEVVLRAEAKQPREEAIQLLDREIENCKTFEIVSKRQDATNHHRAPTSASISSSGGLGVRRIGTSEITQGNIDNNHIYLRSFLTCFPQDAIGGSSKSEAARREVLVDWGGPDLVSTDLDGTKKFFRKRSWIRAFFAQNGIRAGDVVAIDEIAPFTYRVSAIRDK